VIRYQNRKGTREANSRHRFEYHPRTRQTRIATGRRLSTVIQPRPLSTGIWQHLFKRWSQPPRHYQGNHRRYVHGQNLHHYWRPASGTVPMDASKADIHPKEEREETTTRHADMVR